jgi:hypothetical protein
MEGILLLWSYFLLSEGLSNDDDGAVKGGLLSCGVDRSETVTCVWSVLCFVSAVSVEALRMRWYLFYRVRAVCVRVSAPPVILTTGGRCYCVLLTIVWTISFVLFGSGVVLLVWLSRGVVVG